jgi:hypothetical protein
MGLWLNFKLVARPIVGVGPSERKLDRLKLHQRILTRVSEIVWLSRRQVHATDFKLPAPNTTGSEACAPVRASYPN